MGLWGTNLNGSPGVSFVRFFDFTPYTVSVLPTRERSKRNRFASEKCCLDFIEISFHSGKTARYFFFRLPKKINVHWELECQQTEQKVRYQINYTLCFFDEHLRSTS